MLIIPFDRRLDWRHPPLVTLGLLLVNVLVFLFAQLDDGEEAAEATRYYFSSGLAAMEVPKFRKYLKTHHADRVPEEALGAADEWPGWMGYIQTDLGFQERLKAGRVISRLSDDFELWQSRRAAFEQRYAEITYVRYGLRTAQPSFTTLISHMFLHGGLGHLLGNALFLVAVGFLVEATLTRWMFLTTYLLAGLGSAGFNFLFDPPSLVPGIGASGAISGLMGMYTVLYGLRRIRFFYSIGIYFDYVRLPAIVLLPAWIGKEVFQIWLYPDSNINYMAHLGGLVTGAVLAFGVKYFTAAHSMERIEREDAEQIFDQELAAVRQLCDNFDYRKALPILRRLYRQQPDHPALLHLYHEAARTDPASDEYHELANRLMQLRPGHPDEPGPGLSVYREYLKWAKPGPRFKAKSLLAVLPALLGEGELQEAERIVLRLARQPGHDPRLGVLTLQLARALKSVGEQDKGERYRRLAESWSARIDQTG